jgi:hypothetical protein
MKKEMFTLLLMVFMLQISCIEKSNDLLPAAIEKISLTSLITNNKIVRIQVSRTANVTDSIWETDFSNARLIFTANNDTIQTDYTGNGVFQSINCISSEIHTVSFTLFSNKDTLSGIDEIPKKPTNMNVSYSNDLFLDEILPWIPLTIEYDKTLETQAYYETDVYMITDETIQKCALRSSEPVITSQRYYPQIEAFANNHLSVLIFPAKLTGSETEQVQILYASPIVVQQSSGDNYIPEHQLVVTFRAVSDNYYKYKTSYLEQLIKRQGDIIFGGSSGIDVYSNISGGYGIFAGYSELSDTIQVERIYY